MKLNRNLVYSKMYEKGINLTQLAELTELTPKYVQTAVKSGNCGIKAAYDISKVLGLELEDIITMKPVTDSGRDMMQSSVEIDRLKVMKKIFDLGMNVTEFSEFFGFAKNTIYRAVQYGYTSRLTYQKLKPILNI